MRISFEYVYSSAKTYADVGLVSADKALDRDAGSLGINQPYMTEFIHVGCFLFLFTTGAYAGHTMATHRTPDHDVLSSAVGDEIVGEARPLAGWQCENA